MYDKLISIVLPTFNRKEYLKLTLDCFLDQVNRNANDISFCVCNNASTDGTDSFLEKYNLKNKNVGFVNFTEHVDVGYSISRANDLANGKYILMWGDDDIPNPYLLDVLLKIVKEHSDVGLVHYNRLVGYDDNIDCINKLTVNDRNTSCSIEFFNTINDFLVEHALDITFLSSFIFKNDLWKRNRGEVITSSHFGYEFLGKILHGFMLDKICYIPFPLCIQRKPYNRPWMSKSPYYRFIGIPNMYADFEKWGLIKSAQELWSSQGNRNREFFSIMSQTSIFKNEYRPIYKDMLKSQSTIVRKLWTLIFIFLFPGWIYKFVRKRVFSNS